MVSFSSVALFALAYASCLVNALPLVGRSNLDVAAPPVTYPTQGVVWTAGETQTVTWDTSTLPAQITNPTGKVVLGWTDSTGSLNLQLNTPLANGFPITAGKVNIVVPSQYPNGNTYIIALIGSADNISPTFTIIGAGGSSPSSPVNPSPSTTTATSSPASKPTPAPGGSPSTTQSSGPSNVLDAPSPNSSSPSVAPSPGPHSSPSPGSHSSPSSGPSSSPSPSGTLGNSNGSNTSANSGSGWTNKPASTMVISLFAACLFTALFI